jgi:tRNA threonylcarbamoyladenosine biosynthesis protein TsaB
VGCPVIAINTLDALAANLPFAALPVCPVIDAKKHEVYAAFYHCQTGAGQVQGNYLLLPPEELIARIQEPTIITGPGLERYADLFRDRLGDMAVLPPPGSRHVRAGVLARLGQAQYAAGGFPDLDQLTPFYLRPADAELTKPARPGQIIAEQP